MRAVRTYLAPRWLAAHVLLVVACAVMVRLGLWQWHVGEFRNNDFRNYAYALQWWAFTAFAVFFWLRMMRDAQSGPTLVEDEPPPSPVRYRPYVMPQADEIDAGEDLDLAAYNLYLRSLHGDEK